MYTASIAEAQANVSKLSIPDNIYGLILVQTVSSDCWGIITGTICGNRCIYCTITIIDRQGFFQSRQSPKMISFQKLNL